LISPITPQRGGTFVLIATVLLTGLASGALACLLALMIKQDPSWLMLPFGIAIGAFTRWQGHRGARGGIAAAAAMLICLGYTQYLYAAVRMADMLGFPLRDTLFKMDWRLAWQIVSANFGAWNGAGLIASVVAAICIAGRK
jgi:hypothetical protein